MTYNECCSTKIALYMKYINNSFHLARKYARVRVHVIICSETRTVFEIPRAKVEENCELQGTGICQQNIGLTMSTSMQLLIVN